jgi:hypothetical protein
MKKINDILSLANPYIGILFIAMGLIYGCSERQSDEAPDGYYFEQPEYVKTELEVKMVLFKEKSEFRKVAMEKGAWNDGTVQAFGTINPDGNSCTIYTYDATVKYQPHYWGHELAHCVYGRWHQEQNAKRAQQARFD